MRLPIRSQILLPLAAVQVVAVTVVSTWAAWTAAQRVGTDVERQLAALGESLETASYPITSNVLRQMKQLSGADYVLFDLDGTIVESTLALPEETVERSLPRREPVPGMTRAVTISGTEYRGQWVDAGRSAPPRRVLILSPQQRLHELERDAIVGPLVTGALILTLTILATTFVAHRMGKRMQQVERQVARIAAGDFEPLILHRRNDEIRDLSVSVNSMGQALKSLTASIRDNERAQLTAQVVGGFAHQVRNAMTGVRMAIQVHQRRCHAAADSSLGVALAQLTFTEQQIRGLLALARGEERLAGEGQALELLREIATMIGPICEHRRITFQFDPDCAADSTVADADAFRSAVLNLCMNGIEAAGNPGLLVLAARQGDARLTIEVHDNGRGVPEHLTEAIFAPFFTTKPEGVGLGLALARRAAADLGGGVGVMRRDERTVFTLTCAVSSASPNLKAVDAPQGPGAEGTTFEEHEPAHVVA